LPSFETAGDNSAPRSVPNTYPFPARSATGVRIHPTAVVDRSATIGADVEIGPFAIVEGGACIGDRTRIVASAFVARQAQIGDDCVIHVGAVIGQPAQIRDLRGPGGTTIVGARTVIREHVTVHRASHEGGQTMVGADNLLMAGCHVAHDCRTGDHVTIANGTLLAGCVTIGDRAFLSGNVVVHQFVRIGELAMIGGLSRVSKDVPPFMLIVGDSKVCGVNVVGLRRARFTAEQRRAVRRAYSVLYRSGLAISRAVDRLHAEPSSPEIDAILRFIDTSTRGLCAPRRRGRPPVIPEEV
jgi:UDP-N-acetylglucosamine acyltransferase